MGRYIGGEMRIHQGYIGGRTFLINDQWKMKIL